MNCSIPNNFSIYRFILMGQDISHPYNFFLRNVFPRNV